jgi:hypothetical protein
LRFNREMRRWHWISAALCLAAVLLFSVTGITLNHAASITAVPDVTTREAVLSPHLLASLGERSSQAPASVPDSLREWLRSEIQVDAGNREAEWSESEIYVSMPAPGADAWLSIDLTDGAARYEHTDRGWIAFLNDAHKGRHTGPWWNVFIDVVAVACIVFSLTGLVLLQTAARQRQSTWPLVGSGVALVAVLLLCLH